MVHGRLMKLAFSTNAFTKIPLAEAMKLIREIGYVGVEIMADKPHCWPLDRARGEWEEIQEKARALDLQICNINAFMMKAVGDIHHPSWIEKDPDRIRQRRAHTEASLEMAHFLEAPSISTEPGGPLEDQDRSEAMKTFRVELQKMAPVAENLSVRLLIEPEPELLLEGLKETIDFVDTCGLKSLGINFDVGHFFCINEDPAALIRSYPECLEHIHIEDIAKDREHRHLIPGLGAIDYKSLFAALHEVGYDGYLTVELYPYEEEPMRAAEEAYAFLNPFLKG